MKSAKVCLLALLCFFVLQGLWCGIVWAKAVPSGLANEVVSGWLAKEAKPMGSPLGSEVESVKTFTDSNGEPVYYVVNLKPSGFVVVSADDLVEPIVCFSSEGSYDSSEYNPLGALVSRDMPARVNVSRSVHEKLLAGSSTWDLTKQQARVHKSGEKAFGKWTELLSSAGSISTSASPVSSISDVRVSPLLQSEWGQDVICSNKACYNYYTPPYSAGNVNNYYDGCVATAMAQYMRFWRYPTSGVGRHSFTIYVDSGRRRSSQTAYLRGGDGSGGAYDWNDMTLVPGCSTTDTQRQAIGALTYDAGVAVNMEYASSGSGAYMDDAAAAMVDTFGYSNAIIGGNEEYNIGSGINAMINPNLDSGNPVMLGISGDGGHAIVADGYGYQSSTLYHHLNMGWDGEKDVWYNLPNIDTSYYTFTIVDSVIYNIYTSGTGEIISGRVRASDSSTLISGATVTAVRTGGGTYQTTTNTNGIYALVKVPSNSTYTISVVSAGHSFSDVNTSTGQSQDGETTSGNCWAINFVSSCDVPSAPTGVSAGDGTYTDHVRVIWDSVSGATAYEVWRGTDSNSNLASKLGDSTASPFDDSSVTPGTTYYYWVKARNSCETSDFSSSNSGYASCAFPSAPTGVSAGDGTYTDRVRVIWDSVSGAISYEVWRGTDSNSSLASKLGNYTSPFDDSSVTPGTTYYYWVKAGNSCGTSDFSSSNSGYACDIPSAPASVSAGDGTYTGHVRVTWDSVSGAISYEVWRGIDSNSSLASKLGDYTSPYDDYGVTKGTTYYYWVKAKKSCGTSDFGSSDSGYVSTSPSSYSVYSVSITKCTVAAGSKGDSISFSGTMNATADNFNDVNNSSDANFVEVAISDENSEGMAPCVITFPINGKTWKKGKFSYSGTENGVKKSFSYVVNTGKFTFTASRINLSGLECPMIIDINVGDFAGTADVNEAMVNSTKPIPINLLMGVKNSLRVYGKPKFTKKSGSITRLAVRGGFSVEDTNVSMANRVGDDLVVTLGTQTFTIPANKLKAWNRKFTCSKVKLYDSSDNLIGIATATFDFNKCTFALRIKRTDFAAAAGTADFGIAFAGFSGSDEVTLP